MVTSAVIAYHAMTDNWTVYQILCSRSSFSKIFHVLLFGWTLRMYWPNLISVALPVPRIIAGIKELRAVPGCAVQGHPSSLLLVPIESAYAISY